MWDNNTKRTIYMFIKTKFDNIRFNVIQNISLFFHTECNLKIFRGCNIYKFCRNELFIL